MPFLVVVPFVVVVTGFVALALAAMAQSQASAYHSWLDGYLGRVGSIISVPLNAALDLARWITRKLGDHFAGIERLTVGWIAGLFQYAATVITFTLLWPYELFKVTFWLLDKEIPRLIRALPTAATNVVHWLKPRIVRIEKTVIKLPKLTAKQARDLIGAAVATYIAPYLHPLHWLAKNFHALTVALDHALNIPRGWTPTQVRRWVRKAIREYGLSAAFAGAVAVALSRLQLGWLRCSALRRAGKRIGCGGFGLLESFLADAFEVFLVTNLCTFIHLMSQAAKAIRPELLAFVRLENVLIGCHGNKRPPYLAHTTAEAPPATDPLPLAA